MRGAIGAGRKALASDETTSMETKHEYHVRRAREELDLAYRSERRAVSTAHLRLSALHMAELRALTARAAPGRDSMAARSSLLSLSY